MGMFYNKLVESAVDDVIQTPDDIGVDLDAIEKNIVGDDGCEAHREEIDDAMKGVVGDPLEEAAYIMYESEYNFNQLMKCIGLAELNEMSVGSDFILEGVNKSKFFENMRTIFTNMFTTITTAFKNVMDSIATKMNPHKQLVAKHEAEIKAGYNNGTWEFECFDIEKLTSKKYEFKESPILDKADDAVRRVLTGDEWTKEDNEELRHSVIAKRVFDEDVTHEDQAAGEMVSKLNEKLFVKVKYSSNGTKPSLETVLSVLMSNNDVKELKDTYAKVKNDYKNVMDGLKSLEKRLSNKKEEAANKEAMHICMSYLTAARYERSLQDSLFKTILKGYNTRRNQAHRMANVWRAAAPASATKTTNESASVFNVTII